MISVYMSICMIDTYMYVYISYVPICWQYHIYIYTIYHIYIYKYTNALIQKLNMISDGCSNRSNSRSLVMKRLIAGLLLFSRESIWQPSQRVAQKGLLLYTDILCIYIYTYIRGCRHGVWQILTVTTPWNPTLPLLKYCTQSSHLLQRLLVLFWQGPNSICTWSLVISTFAGGSCICHSSVPSGWEDDLDFVGGRLSWCSLLSKTWPMNLIRKIFIQKSATVRKSGVMRSFIARPASTGYFLLGCFDTVSCHTSAPT